MEIQIAASSQKETHQAVAEIVKGLANCEPSAVMFFGSSRYDPHELSRLMQQAFPGLPVFGCTTAGELASGVMTDGSIVAIAFDSTVVKDISIEVLHDIHIAPVEAVDRAFDSFATHFHAPLVQLDPSQYVGIVLMDGLSRAEEKIMERIGDLTELTFVGGSAGDDLKFQKTFVFAHGEVYSDAALLIVFKSGVPFEIIKTQSFQTLDNKLVATCVNAADRTVLEFNHQPALNAYAVAVNTPAAQASESFMKNPLGLMVDGEPFVRSPQQVVGSSLVFYCNIAEGTELSLLEGGDIIEDTRVALEKKLTEMGAVSGIINFHCILRTLQLKQEGRTQAYADIFKHYPMVGFSTYGEAYIGHINQTSTMLIFKK
jgi:hypothetical protein